ncbi:hypothetical protein [Methanobrevibacter woesei]|uniref:hypothetical protein n=1 Tax=Methanobrevibacter woesei TaxID=190976 RepID=UPI0023EFD19D|nr:hypothetical protein [Methanobrevibacter woesei]
MGEKTKLAIGVVIIIALIAIIGFFTYSANVADERDFGEFSLNIPNSYEFINTTFENGYTLLDREHAISITYMNLTASTEKLNKEASSSGISFSGINFADLYQQILGEISEELEDDNPSDNISYYNATNLAETLSNTNTTEDYGAVYASNSTLIIIETTDLEELRSYANSLKVKV